jgi:Hint module
MCGVDASSNYNSQHRGTNYIRTFTTYKGPFSTSDGPAATNAPGTEPNGSDDGSGDASGFCFSAVSTAQVEGKGRVAMMDLKIGDKVLTGNQKYETVYGFGHFHATKVARFLQIYTENNRVPLEMTEEHMVFVAGKKNPVRAGSIQVGDVLQSGFGSSQVKKTSSIKREGLYAPLTPDGTIIVDGIKASSYIALQDRAVEYLELQHGFHPMSQHDAVHLFLAPFRLICRATSADFCHEYNDNGMPHYVANGLKLAQWIDALDMNVLLQVSLLSIFLVVFASIMAIEVAMDTFYTYGAAVVLFVLTAIFACKTVGINVSAKKIKKVA